VNQAKHTMLHGARLAELGDLAAARNYLRLARRARAEGLDEEAAYRLQQALDTRRVWHRSRRPLLLHFFGRRA